MRGAHRFFWGYGPSGYDILSREGEGRSLEAACLEEVNRWKLAFDREAQGVTPVHAGGKPVALLAFKSRVSARAAGDKVRETACAAIAWESATEPAAHEYLLELVPPIPLSVSAAGPAGAPPTPRAGTGPRARAALPAWAGATWAHLLNNDAVLVMDEASASMEEALRVVSLLPPAVARHVAVGEGLLPEARPRGHGLYIAPKGAARSDRVDPPSAGRPSPAGAPARQLEGLAQAWFEREVAPLVQVIGGTARELWDRCASDAQCDISAFEFAHLQRAMMSDAAHDWLLAGPQQAAANSMAAWLDAGLAAGVSAEPGRLARLIDTTPPEIRSLAADRLPRLAARLGTPEADLAAVMVGAALEDALERASRRELECALFNPQTWIGSVLSGTHGTSDGGVYANAAWSLVGELLALWAAQKPDVLARALARPTRGAPDGAAGWLRRLARRLVRPRSIEDVLRKLAKRRTPDAALVSERLLPNSLRTVQGRNGLRPQASVLEDLFAAAVLTAARTGGKVPGAVAALAPLLPRPAALPA